MVSLTEPDSVYCQVGTEFVYIYMCVCVCVCVCVYIYIQADPVSADSVCAVSVILGFPRPEKKFGKLKK